MSDAADHLNRWTIVMAVSVDANRWGDDEQVVDGLPAQRWVREDGQRRFHVTEDGGWACEALLLDPRQDFLDSAGVGREANGSTRFLVVHCAGEGEPPTDISQSKLLPGLMKNRGLSRDESLPVLLLHASGTVEEGTHRLVIRTPSLVVIDHASGESVNAEAACVRTLRRLRSLGELAQNANALLSELDEARAGQNGRVGASRLDPALAEKPAGDLVEALTFVQLRLWGPITGGGLAADRLTQTLSSYFMVPERLASLEDQAASLLQRASSLQNAHQRSSADRVQGLLNATVVPAALFSFVAIGWEPSGKVALFSLLLAIVLVAVGHVILKKRSERDLARTLTTKATLWCERS